MARVDARAPALGVPVATLMANAGRAVAREVRRRFRPCRTLVLCGPGNNGGDGYVAARLLQGEGWPVAVASLAPQRPGSDAAAMAARWHGPTVAFSPDEASRASLVIDAVFGAGLTRPVEGLAAATLKAVKRLVAVDTPSGVDGATGAVRGFAPRAALTVTFVRLKPGHLLDPGRDLCGETVLADIGMPPQALADIRASAFANDPALWRIPRPEASGHKYSRGHVTVLGGKAMTGAARMAAGAARRAGAGMMTIAAESGADIYRTGEAGVIVTDKPLDELLEDERRRVWVCGPGFGREDARTALPKLIGAKRAVVGDADVFAAFAGEPDALKGVAVLTPHAGEFLRVFGDPGDDRLGAARRAAARTGGVVLLKGSDTIIAAPDGRAAINASAPPWLATAGSGDVLSGVVAGFLAQGMPAWEAASAAAWVHGRAGLLAGPGMLAEDLPALLPRAIAEAG
ncbi:MAG: NAD(P)H-hydrate dehydratase [Acetobacteraceae bacterium]|nr:NAD(P)H-hydrate dehydratase [Acetobacteraceae bacterium]